MIVIYSIVMSVFVILYFCTLPYKKKLRKKLKQKEYPLKNFYGLAMFITDRFPKKIFKKNDFINKAVRELKVKEDTKREKYLYIVNKVSICIIGVLITIMLGLGIEVSKIQKSGYKIEELKRDANNNITYDIYAENEEGKQEEISVEVPKKKLKEEEVIEKIQSYQQQLVDKVLDKNDSAEYVIKPLNLLSSIGKEKIQVSWNISDSSVIGYDGALSDEIPPEGNIVQLIATMTYREVSVEYSFSVNVYPKQESTDIQHQVQSYINKEDEYSEEVKLPVTINGKKMSYLAEKVQGSGVVIILGLLVSISLFFLKDNDLKKELKEREHQLMVDYPEIVSKLLLYHSAGLSVKTAIEKIVSGYQEDKKTSPKIYRYAYEELEVALIKMKSGVSETTAICEYGKRCGLHCYIKLSGIIEQNIRRGTSALTIVLKNELESSMTEKKNVMLKEGGKISTKLMGPMIIMLVIAIAIIMIPAFMSMNL